MYISLDHYRCPWAIKPCPWSIYQSFKWGVPHNKNQISNKSQHAAQAPALRVTEIQKSKQSLGLEGLVTCREPLGRTIEYWNLNFTLRLCSGWWVLRLRSGPWACRMACRTICNLVLGICDFRHKTPRQSQISLIWPRGPGFSGHNKS